MSDNDDGLEARGHRVNRPTWDDIWMSNADAIGQRSRCHRATVGAVFVSQDNLYSVTGYVGPPANFAPAEVAPDSDCRDWCPRAQPDHTPEPGYEDCVSCHAEMNAVAKANSDRIQGGTAYVNAAMCLSCAKVTAAARVARVVMKVSANEAHRNPQRTIDYLTASGIAVELYRKGLSR